MRNDSGMCAKIGEKIDSMISDLDKDIDYNTFSQLVGEVCVRVLPEKVKLKEHMDWFDGRRKDVLYLHS